MPENNLPAPNPSPEAAPGEFDFVKPVAETPRVKRRSLKPASGAPAAAKELAQEAPPLSVKEAQPAYTANPREDDDAESNAEVEMIQPEPARPAATTPPAKVAQPYTRTTTARPTPTSTPSASPGTRPATLYYSNGPAKVSKAKEPEPASPMKTTPSASPAPSTSPASTTRPATAASSVRPTSVVDYRTNVERQAREQKSVGNILAYVVYALAGLFVFGALLAGYGAYVVSKELRQQSVTVTELDSHYAAEIRDLNVKLASNLESLTQAQSQIAHEQDLILKQQDTINKLLSTTQDTATALRQEKQARADETASLRTRLRNLEYKGPGSTTQRY